MFTHDVLLRPVVSEKAVLLQGLKQYAFIVDIRATKPEIKKAIELFYNVEVKEIQTVQFRQSPRRQSRKRVENPAVLRKKAYVHLKVGQSIQVLEVEKA